MKQIGELTARDYMTELVIVVGDKSKLTEAIRIMDRNQLSAVPVVDDDENLVGILSNRDLIGMIGEVQSDLNALHHVNEKTREFFIQMLMDHGDSVRVLDVMTSPVETVHPEANLVVAARKLTNREFHHLPVVGEDKKPIGILSASDFVRAIAEHGAIAAG